MDGAITTQNSILFILIDEPSFGKERDDVYSKFHSVYINSPHNRCLHAPAQLKIPFCLY